MADWLYLNLAKFNEFNQWWIQDFPEHPLMLLFDNFPRKPRPGHPIDMPHLILNSTHFDGNGPFNLVSCCVDDKQIPLRKMKHKQQQERLLNVM